MITQPRIGESIFEEIKTLEQGKSYILEIVSQVESARAQLDLISAPATTQFNPTAAQKAYANLHVRYGQALGALVTLMHCRVLSDEAYAELRAKVDTALAPKVVGIIRA